MKIAHIYASNAKINSGDFMIGIATKKYFEEHIIKQKCTFSDFDCRIPELFTNKSITNLNSFDCIIVGGGGLLLPDTNPNKISCWQWQIPVENYDFITAPIYVISIGLNLFYGQTMNMPIRENNQEDLTRMPILKKNLEKLINKSEHFTVRHNGDIENIKKIIDEKYHSKLKLEMCPTTWYSKTYWKPLLTNTQQYIGIEIKDDRKNRRYYKIGEQNFYNELILFIKNCGKPCCYLTHDGSKSFYNYAKTKGVNLPLLDNSVANERKIYENFSKIHTLLCTAGHSQMIAYSLGIKIISLVTHPKLEYFCKDVGDENYIIVNKEEPVNISKKLIQYEQNM